MPNNQRQRPRPAHAPQSEPKVAERAASTPDGTPSGGPKKPSAARKSGGPAPRQEHVRR
jgi:hypothetical protein